MTEKETQRNIGQVLHEKQLSLKGRQRVNHCLRNGRQVADTDWLSRGRLASSGSDHAHT